MSYNQATNKSKHLWSYAILDDFLSTKTLQIRCLEDLGIADDVITVIYEQGFFDYKGVSVWNIDLNVTGKYVTKNLTSLLKNYNVSNGAMVTRFSFGGHYKSGQGLNMFISVRYSDQDKFSDMLNI